MEVVKLRKRAQIPVYIEMAGVKDYRVLPIPGLPGRCQVGMAYIKATNISEALDEFMEINPRVPSRTKKGILAGPVAQGILQTLREAPEQMAVKNQGIYILAEDVAFDGKDSLVLTLRDQGKHGIINGGHTYAAIREAVETADIEERQALEHAYVRVHIFQGVDEDLVPEMAEGLNRSKQVDDPSLANLQGSFDIIRKVLKGHKGEHDIAYHQGDEGSTYISEALVYLEMFNLTRFNERKHPNGLYNKQGLGLRYFSEDLEQNKVFTEMLVKKLPDFLVLRDSIRKLVPEASRANKFKFGMARFGSSSTAGSAKNKEQALPFLGESTKYRVPNGWVYPIMAAFRANLTVYKNDLVWRVPIEQMLPEVIEELVGVCVSEHKDGNLRPEQLGKRESVYSQCYIRAQLYLAKKAHAHFRP